MGAHQRRPPMLSCPGAAVPILLLILLAASFGGRRHAAAVDAAPGPGTPAMTELQKHAAFFDRNHDGIITINETYRGLREIGFGSVKARASAALINTGLGPKTRPGNANSSRMDIIYIVNIHKGIHGSDTGAYDAQGRFVPAKLDEMFTKHGKTVRDAMTKHEVDEMLKANRDSMDFIGWLAASSEWNLLYELAKDKDGYLRKDNATAIYDGSLFYQLAARGKKD